MPVAARHSTIMEMSHQISTLHLEADEDRIDRNDEPRLCAGLNLLEDIIELRDKIELYQKEEADAKRSMDTLVPTIREGQDSLRRAEERKSKLVEKNQLLEKKLQSLDRIVEGSTLYWKDNYGLDVRQISKPDDPYDQYEFVFSKLSRKSNQSADKGTSSDIPQDGDTNNQTPPAAHNKQQITCSINLRYKDRKLEIVDQVPQVLSTEEVAQLNDKLTHHCVNQEDGTVNYRSATTLIRKDLKRNLSPSPRTWPHPQVETNSHTCT